MFADVLLPSNKNAYHTLHVISLECKKDPPEGVKPILSKLKNNLSKDRYPHNFVMSKKKTRLVIPSVYQIRSEAPVISSSTAPARRKHAQLGDQLAP